MRYLDPKNDLIFKKVFGEHPHLLISFLNAMLPLETGQEVVEIEYLPPELVPEVPRVRNSIVDVRCRSKEGRLFIVEMQMLWTESFQQRVLFNASKAYVRQLSPGIEFKYLQPVISLNLLNDTYLPAEEGWYHHYRITEVQGTGRVIEGLEFVFIELPKFKPQTFTERKLRALWLRFLTEVGQKPGTGPPKELFEVPELKEALEIVQESSFTDQQIDAYDRYWDAVRVERAIKLDALEEGRREGLEEGRREGEKIVRMQLARAMLNNGYSPSEVSKITGIPESEIAEFQKLVK